MANHINCRHSEHREESHRHHILNSYYAIPRQAQNDDGFFELVISFLSG